MCSHIQENERRAYFLFLNTFSVNKNIKVGNALRYLLKIDLLIHARNIGRKMLDERTIKLLCTCKWTLPMSDIKDFLKDKINQQKLESCTVASDGISVECCSCTTVSSIEGNTASTGLNVDEVGACKRVFICPKCGWKCCLDHGGYKPKNKRKTKIK